MDPKLRRKIVKCVRKLRTITFTEACQEYDFIIIDLSSIVYGLKRPIEFLKNLSIAQTYSTCRSRFIIVLDYSKDVHVRVSRRYIELIRELGLDFEVSPDEPAEIKAAKICRQLIEKGYRSIVLSRDYDPLTIIDEELMPCRRFFYWTVDHIVIDRKCIESLM